MSWLVSPITPDKLLTLLYLGVLTQIAALRPIPWRSGHHQWVVDPLLVAASLYAPGAGVALIAWLAVFDGRVPGRTIPWWAFFFNRAMIANANIVPSIAVASLGSGADWSLPVRTAILVVAGLGLNYLITALSVSFVTRTPVLAILFENLGGPAVIGTAALSFSGGIIYLLLQTPVGYIMAPGLFGFVLAVRGNVADAQRQSVLKEQTLELAAQALDARDRYTESHSIRVAELAGRLGERLELGDREVELIRTAASLHDLGKIGVRDDILNKPGPLTEEEWEIMRRHPDIGADMIAQHSALEEVAPVVRHHHERWDGSGYPAGLKGDVIPFGARILSVADSYDTITGARLYRKSLMTPIEGVEDISRRASQWYDPNVVDALRELHGLPPMEVVDRPEVPRRITSVRVLRSNPGFSSLVAAVAVSSLGDPLTQVAALISIYAQTHDPRLVALGLIVQAVATIVVTGLIGGIADRLPRRGLVVSLEFTRAACLIATPMLIGLNWRLIVPILFLLSTVNAVVQPAKQAAVPSLVPVGQVGKANAVVAATTMLASSVGFGIAAAVLTRFPSALNALFIADAMTFIVGAVIILGIPNLGGGAPATSLSGALRRSWSVLEARPQLGISTLAAFLIPMSLPAILAMAYQVSIGGPQAGPQTYSTLELVASVGIFVGSLAVSRFTSIGSMRTVGIGLLLTGTFSVAIGMTRELGLIIAALLIASVGNPVYSVANQTALVEAAPPQSRGSVMATRFGLTQAAGIVGLAAGGFLTQRFSPQITFDILGIGIVILALYALAAGRSTVNPLHGAAYEEAALQQAKT
ncbi:MAG TPA: MFS transporter [Candidatus Dormibacteraeota bacterium]|nr:MFS transporter [Candidatus Dormibacteraeota bacterium]